MLSFTTQSFQEARRAKHAQYFGIAKELQFDGQHVRGVVIAVIGEAPLWTIWLEPKEAAPKRDFRKVRSYG